ncbi:hypothetical protein FH972_023305 [Carpinus fangiana]|uniref:Uncharacterized protein n=1 Tax=Carpinus fangiana TaxID=176857 RepID=A0A5N6KUU2_9ROSI|nr:hypothetical protein FH972_023305 [Carpinus fangiana]
MARLREISRTAAFAWSNSITKPVLATGTRAGAVDSDFSTETQLELWDLDLNNKDASSELQPIASIPTDSRFYDLAWSEPSTDHPDGVIAGALENGALNLWDAAKLKAKASDALFSSTSKHTGAIKALQFNPHRPELLASAGDKGELYITDLNKPSDPFRIGTTAARSDNFDCLDWNKKVPHILVTGSSAGFVTVWDVKAKKESLTLNNYGRKPVSAVAWNPDVPTKLATAIPTDQDPLILMWDLRNSSAPERILKGHDQGVLSLAWCGQDSDLLLSCGKDNRSICWNPHTAQTVGEFPIVTNWTFQTRWHPRHPSLCATASFDGKIVVQTIQNTKIEAVDATATQTADGADFFAKAQSQPQGASFSLPKPPKWMRRPAGASFGFGGKLVTFRTPEDQPTKSSIKITTFVADESVESSISDFQTALEGDKSASVIESRIEGTESDASKEDWRVIKALTSDAPRKALLSHLGFEDKKEAGAATEPSTEEKDAQANGTATKDSNRLSSFFDNSADSQGFLADLAASKGAKTNNPFQIFKGSESATDKDLTKALLLGNFEEAVDLCLTEKRISDAFMVAVCGGQKCIDKVQAAYFAQQSDGPNYLRLLAAVVGKNLWDVVYNADLANWKEVMATLCTYADQSEFPDLCEALGDRLEEQNASRKDAAFCYLAGSKLEKVVPIWVGDMQEGEKTRTNTSTDESEFSIHVQSLQGFIEKVSIFRSATKYEDKDGKEKSADWKLEPLYQRYAEYADVVAGHGHLDLAQKFLDLLPAQYPAAEVARNRIKQAGRKVGAQRAQPANVSAAANNPFQPMVVPSAAARAPQSAYAPNNAYAPAGFQSQQSPASPFAPGGSYGGFQAPTQSLGPPPQAGMSAPPSGPPPPSNKNVNGASWNDLPENFVTKPVSRRGTPAAPPVASPFSNSNQAPSAYGSSFQAPPPPTKSTPPLPPPPKVGQAPFRTGSPLVDRTLPDPTQRPPSAAASAYAPAPGAPPGGSSNIAPPVAPPARGASPYQPPPSQSAGPPSNRYAPAAGSAPSPAPPGGYNAPGARPIAPSPYAPPQTSTTSSQYGAPPQQGYGAPPPQPQTRPPTGPPPMASGPPPGGPPRGATPSQPPPPPAATAATAQYPAGDRSHIAPEAVPVFEFLNAEVQRVLGKAPAQFKPKVQDTQKRLNILFDQLNNGALSAAVVQTLSQVVQAMQARNFDQAKSIFGDLMKQPEVGGSKWMVGLKNLIPMSSATPPA